MVWTGLGPVIGSCEQSNEKSGSLLTELVLVSQERLYSLSLVNFKRNICVTFLTFALGSTLNNHVSPLSLPNHVMICQKNISQFSNT
jgi:hypothetical protein